MIVTCENCDTRFNLDENLIKESGSKVRCSKCHHIFTVHKLVPVEERDSVLEDAPADLAVTADSPLPSLEAEEAPQEAAAVSEETPEEVLDFDLSEAEGAPAEEEISLEAFGLEEEPGADEAAPVEKEIAVEEIAEAVEETPEEVAAVSEEASEGVLDLDLSELEEEPAEEEISLEAFGLEEEPGADEAAPVEEEIAVEETGAKEEPKEEVPDTVSAESLEEVEEGENEQVEEELMPPLVAKDQLQARKRISTPLTVVLVLALLVGGGFGTYRLLKRFDVEIPLLESLMGAPGSATVDPGNLRITTLEQLIKTEFVENSTAGSLFVIKGKVRNDYPEARNFLMVKGVLYSKAGKTVQEKTVYCGNTLSDTDLQALDKATINTRLRNRFGDEKSNFKVPSGKVIPFVVVFSDLPQDLGEFSVEVVSSAPV